MVVVVVVVVLVVSCRFNSVNCQVIKLINIHSIIFSRTLALIKPDAIAQMGMF